jgi:cardiolipin synthase C
MTSAIAIRRLLAWCLVVLLAACGSLPPRVAPPASSAFTDTGDTALGRIAAASLPADSLPGPSGFRLLPTGEFAFEARTALAALTQRSLDAQYYHIHADPAGAVFLRELRDAARRGVRVRLLVDDYHAGEVYPLLQGLAAHDSVEVRLFNPLLARYGPPLKRFLLSAREYSRVNHRMHNKLFIADNAVALYGGRNVADEYFSRHGSANFVDLDVVSVGPVVRALSASFDDYWNSAQVWSLHQVLGPPGDLAARRADFDRLVAGFPMDPLDTSSTDPLRQTSVGRQLAEGRLQLLSGQAQVHADPPDKVGGPVVLNQPTRAMQGKLDVIGAARESVVIVNPYYLPGEVGMRMMAEAARRGVRGTIVTNSLASTDEPLVHRAYSRYRAAMLALGMQLYEFGPELARRTGSFGNFGQSTGRLHAKAAVVDGRWLLVGSVNLDGRSAILNTELGVSIDCPPLAQQAMALLTVDAFASMYRVVLAPDGRSLQWHSRRADGSIAVEADEPHHSSWLQFKLWLQSLLVAESSL